MSTQETTTPFPLVQPGALGLRRPLLLSGALSSLVYVANVVVGGLLTPGYSHVRNAVSELTQAGAPYAVALGVPYVVSGLLLAAFGVAVCLESYRTSRRVFTGGFLIGLFAAQAVLLGTVFPMDPLGAPPTFPGTMHLVLVGVSVPLIVSAILLIGFGLDRTVPRWRHFRLYSMVTVLLMFAGGVLTPISSAGDVAILGVAERITQVAYLTWFTLFSIQAYRLGGIGSDARPAELMIDPHHEGRNGDRHAPGVGPMDKVTSRLLWAGLVAAVWHTMVVLVGAMATPGYSHIGQHVSTLYQSGAPNGPWIAALFAVYNLLTLAFGVGVFRLVSNRGGVRQRIGQAGGVALVLTAIAGFMDDVFWQDPIGSPATTAGTLHLAFAGVTSLLTILAIALVAAWALGRPALRRFGWYSVATLVVIAVSGPVAAIATAGLWPTMGLLERIPIFGFVQWAAITSIILARWQPVSRPAAGAVAVRR